MHGEKRLAVSFELFLFFFIIFTPLFYASVTPLPLTIVQLSSFCLLLLLILKVWLSSKIIYPSYTGIIIIFIALGVFQIIPLPVFLLKAISPKTFIIYQQYALRAGSGGFLQLSFYSLVSKEEIIKFISFLIIFFAALNTIEKKKQFERLFLGIIFYGLILSFYGIIKKYFILEKQITHSFSTFGNSNHFAGYMLMVASLAIGYAVSLQNKSKKLIFGFIAAIICATIFLSLSRAGSFALIFSLTLMLFLLMREGMIKKIYWVIGIALILAGIFVFVAGFEPIKFKFLHLVQDWLVRFTLAKDALRIIKDFPLFGVGWGNFRYIYPHYQTIPTFPAYFDYLHNDHLQLMVEMGLVGYFLYFLFLFKIFRNIFIELSKRRDPFVKGIVLGGACGLFGVILHNLVDFDFHIPAIYFLFWLILALIYRCVHTHFHNDQQEAK
jgi:O-antigen ligase